MRARFLSDPENAELAASDTIRYYENRIGEESLKSIETRIASIRKEVEQQADAFVKAKSSLLQAAIEEKMQSYEMLLDDLTKEQAKLLIEKGNVLTKQEILDFIAELLNGNPNDKEYQRKKLII